MKLRLVKSENKFFYLQEKLENLQREVQDLQDEIDRKGPIARDTVTVGTQEDDITMFQQKVWQTRDDLSDLGGQYEDLKTNGYATEGDSLSKQLDLLDKQVRVL